MSNKFIQELAAKAALGKEGVDRLHQGLCPLCGDHIDFDTFRDAQSMEEYTISGICQGCQDEVFKD